MKTMVRYALLMMVTGIPLQAAAQPTYQYNDRTQDQYYNQSHGSVVSSPQSDISDARPLTEEEMRNAKPMGKYIDAGPLQKKEYQSAPSNVPHGGTGGYSNGSSGVVEGSQGEGN